MEWVGARQSAWPGGAAAFIARLGVSLLNEALHQGLVFFLFIVEPRLVNVDNVLLLLEYVLDDVLHVLFHLLDLEVGRLVQQHLLTLQFVDSWLVLGGQLLGLLAPAVAELEKVLLLAFLNLLEFLAAAGNARRCS